MDVIEIDGASNRGIDEIRELRENVRYTPAKSRYKIYIIDEVHMLTREAFNALLKTLEEPPPHIIFVFATTEPHKIPATIVSRCQRYDFKRIPMKEILTNLKKIVEEEKIQISQRALLSIAQESEGSLRDAQSLLDQVISYGGKEIRDEEVMEVLGLIDRKIIYDTLEAIADRNPEKCAEIIEHVYHYGVDLQHFCRELLQYFRHLILIKVSEHPEELMDIPEEEIEVLKREADRFEFDQLNHLFTLLLRGEEQIAQSTFPRTMLEMTLIRMATFPPFVPVDEILRKLERLEGSPAGSMTPQPPKPSRPATVGRAREAEGLERKASPSRQEKAESKEGLRRQGAGRGMVEEEGATSSPAKARIDETERLREGMEKEGVAQREIEETWRGLVDFVRAKNPILGSFLALGTLLHVSADRMEIGFEKDSFHYERIMEKENRSQLETICREYVQREIELVISSLDQGIPRKGRKGLEGSDGGEASSEKPLKEEAAEMESLIQEALRLFDGRIVDK